VADFILSLNAGSSSLRFALTKVEARGEPITVTSGKVEGIGTAPHLIVRDAAGHSLAEQRWDAGQGRQHEAFLAGIFDWVDDFLGTGRLIGVGHRVVHGGGQFAEPVVVSEAVLTALDALCPLAPLHLPHNLAAIRAAQAVRSGLPQIACFDTGFHQSQPSVARRFAIPRALAAEGIRRYGFHGLSYEYIARRLAAVDPAMARGRVIAAHLGNGASLCAMRAGRSIDTTMGFTALDGLVMGTRCGTLDAGVVLYLQQEKGMSPADVQHLLYERSGLLGVSGISSDMRDLLGSEDEHAREAIELFVYRIAAEAGALASALGGVDDFVFTAGIGENAPEIRAQVCQRLAWLGIELDRDANARGAPVISTTDSRIKVRIIPTDEEHMIAIHTVDLIAPPLEHAYA
jgi:acetate kinase